MARPPGCYSTLKCPGIIWLNILQVEYPKYSNVDIALIKVKEEFKGGIYGTLRLPRKDRTLPGIVNFLSNDIFFEYFLKLLLNIPYRFIIHELILQRVSACRLEL